MSEIFNLILEDDENNNTPLTVAEKLLASLIESKDATKLYSPAIIDALARAGHIFQYEAKRRLQAAFGKDFAVREWRARIKEVEVRLFAAGEYSGEYLLNAQGQMKPIVANAITMMKDLPLAYDAFACRSFATAPLPWRPDAADTHWTDNDDVRAAEWCQRQELTIPSRLAAEAAETVARQNEVHPVRDYLQGLVWDGEKRLDGWLTKYIGCEDNAYSQSVAAKWMISAVARVMEPGCQADYTLVFEGEQGKGKSSALRVLAGEWFTDDLADVGTKDSAMQIQGKWIVEIGELDAFRKADITTVKKWLTLRIDDFRPPYGKRTQKFPRQNVFAASTNKYDWGKDPTGLRRFWPVRVVGEIDLEALARDRDQLWAEAMFRYRQREKWFLPKEMERMATEEQEERQDRDVWSDRVEEWVVAPSFRCEIDSFTVGRSSTSDCVFLPEILFHCLGIPLKDFTQGDKNRVSAILTIAKYTRHRRPRSEGRVEYWSPPQPPTKG